MDIAKPEAAFSHQDKVQWEESNGRFTCTGTIVSEDKYQDGTNPYGFWTVKVDDAFYNKACRTATEMHLGWVTRSVMFNNLRKM